MNTRYVRSIIASAKQQKEALYALLIPILSFGIVNRHANRPPQGPVVHSDTSRRFSKFKYNIKRLLSRVAFESLANLELDPIKIIALI